MQTSYPIQNVGAAPELLFICRRGNELPTKTIIRKFKAACESKTTLTISEATGKILKVEQDHLWCKQFCNDCIETLDKAKNLIKKENEDK